MPDTKDTSIDLTIDPSQEKTYFEVPFEMPRNVARFELRYRYRRGEPTDAGTGGVALRELNAVDLALQDEKGRFRGASGTERLCVYLTENEATPGYIPGQLGAGKWAVVFGAYKIQPGGCPVTIELRFTFRKTVLLRGDLHVHSVHSDGKYTVDDILRTARLHGLDYIFLTDHNNYVQNDRLSSSDALVVLPGMEWTHYRGHANFLGVRRPVTDFWSNDRQKTAAVLAQARENGAMVVLNHPFDPSCGWKWGFDVPFDAVEIWNGPIKAADTAAIEWWHAQLCAGMRIPAVGGSDFHRAEMFRQIGTPCTYIYSASRGCSDILDALRRGRCFVAYSPEGPVVELTAGGSVMGDTVDNPPARGGCLTVRQARPGDIFRLITDRGVEYEETNRDAVEKRIPFSIETRRFYRAEVWREFGPQMTRLAAITNPLYIGRHG